MPEQALIDGLVTTILERLRGDGDPFGGEVESVHVRVGELDLSSIASFRQAFAARATGTPLQGVPVDVSVDRARLECPDCGYRGPVRDDPAAHHRLPVAECPQCGLFLAVCGGRGVTRIEVALSEGTPTT